MGTGSALPTHVMSNEDLSKYVDTSDEWIRERTGICSRRISTGETVASLAAKACEQALENAGRRAEDVDLILLATCSPERLLPCSACQVQEKLGAVNAVAFDLNAACAGFLFGLNTAQAYLSAGYYRNALIVGSEVLSKLIDWKDRSTCILFGDGAGAVYVEASAEYGMEGFWQHSIGAKGNVLSCEARKIDNLLYHGGRENAYVQMDGREIFKFAVREVSSCIQQMLTKLHLTGEEVDLFLLHQANARIIDGIAAKLGQSVDKFPKNVDTMGNTSSASIPILLDWLNRSGKLQSGMRIVLSGFGAGLTLGVSVMRWRAGNETTQGKSVDERA